MAVSLLCGVFSHKEGRTTVGQRRVADTASGTATANGTATASRPYAFYVVVIALSLVSVVFLMTIVVGTLKGLFVAEQITTALGSLFTLVGSVVGTYFGIKVSGDTTEKTQVAIERANDTANRALAALPPEEGQRIAGQFPRPTPAPASGQPSGPTPGEPRT